METLRIGIIGAGGIVRSRHLPGLAALPGVEIVAVCNRTRESSQAIAQEWQIPEICEEWTALIERRDLDAIVIGTWPYMHAAMSIAALEAGKHVFCQARMARDAAEARSMVDSARAHPELIAMLCPPPAGMKGDRWMRHLVADDYIGGLRDVHATGFSGSNLDSTAPIHWRQNFDLQGYNTLTLGMWIEVIHRWVGLHRRVCAVLKTHVPERRDPATGAMVPVRIAESVAISAELVSGAVGSYHFSGVAPHPSHNRIELHGTRGSLLYDLDTDEIRGGQRQDADAGCLPIPEELIRSWTVEADFVRAIREGGSVEPSFEDGLAYMEFTEAVYRSGSEGRSVELPLADPSRPPRSGNREEPGSL